MARGNRIGLPTRLPPTLLDDLIDLAKNHNSIETIVTAGDVATPTASILTLSHCLAERTGVNDAVVESVLATLSVVKHLQKNSELADSKAFVDELTQRLTSSDVEEARLTLWKNASGTIAKVLDQIPDDHPLLVSTKAAVLAYTHQNLMMNARIITDLRPVFDTAGTKILETVITHALTINYSNSSSTRTLFTCALDNDDIVALKKECERAERKASVAASTLKNKDLNPVVLPDKRKR